MVFLFGKYIIVNLWLFDIIFLAGLSWLILNLKLLKHQYFSSFFMVIFGIILNAITTEDQGHLIYSFVFIFYVEISYTSEIVLSKYLMDTLFMTPFEITYMEGIFGFIVNSIFLIVATNNELINPPLMIQLAKHCEYEGKTYVDNFYAYWDEFKGAEVAAFIIQMFFRIVFNLTGHFISRDLTPSHIIFLEMIGDIMSAFQGDFDWKKLGSLIIILIEMFLLLIFTEIIEINLWDLNYNTKKNIDKREKKLIESDSKSDDSGDIGGNEMPKYNDDNDYDTSRDSFSQRLSSLNK